MNNNLQIKIDDLIIDQVDKTKLIVMKFLVNENLTWKDHIKTITNKISKSMNIILRIKRNVPVNILITVYHTLVQPYFYYFNIV